MDTVIPELVELIAETLEDRLDVLFEPGSSLVEQKEFLRMHFEAYLEQYERTDTFASPRPVLSDS